MSESEIIKVYQEGIQSVISLVQGLSTQISELSQTVSDLDARLKKLEKQSNQTSQNSSLPPSTDGFKKTKSLRQPSNRDDTYRIPFDFSRHTSRFVPSHLKGREHLHH